MSKLRGKQVLVYMSVGMVVVFAAALGFGAYLESDYEKEPPSPPREPVPPRPPRPDEIAELTGRVAIGAPYRRRGLTIFPVELRGRFDRTPYITIDEASARNDIEITETGVVAGVRVRNLSDRYLFGMSGEVLAGGKQNRLIRDDVLLPPQSGPVTVPVYCGEKGRWTRGGPEKFRSSKRLANSSLRGAAQGHAPQSEIWRRVRDKAEAAGVKSSTEDFNAIASSPKVLKELSEYRKGCRRIWQPRHCGIVVAIHSRIVGAEVFGNRYLFERLRDKLVESYGLERVGCPAPARREMPPPVTRAEALRYLRAAQRARKHRVRSPGVGWSVELSGAASGRALVFQHNVVHMCLYRAVPRPPVRPMPRRRGGG